MGAIDLSGDGLRALLVPTEFDLSAHSGSGRNDERCRLDVPGDNASGEQLDACGCLDVAVQFAADDDGIGTHLTREACARIDGEIAVDVDVALEGAGDAHVAGTLDLSLDRQIRRDK